MPWGAEIALLRGNVRHVALAGGVSLAMLAATTVHAAGESATAVTDVAAAAGPRPARNALAPFGAGPMPGAPWRVAGVPGQKSSLTRFDVVADPLPGALRIRAEASYGNLVHGFAPPRAAPGTLSWRWRVDQAVAGADLRHKPGDDAAVKVCALYDMPIERVPFTERLLLRLARSKSGEELPAATVCYVWDATLPVGTRQANAYSPRLRYLVVASGEQALGMWHSERRDLAADFLRLFGDESPDVPPLAAIAVGADADNTKGQALSYVTDLQLD